VPTIWIDTSLSDNIATGAEFEKSLMTNISSAASGLAQMTLLRTIIGIDISYATHDAGEGSQRLSIGIGVASQEAFAAAALPDPEVMSDFPTKGWVWRAAYRIWGFAADQPTIFTRRVDLDIRAKRKLDKGEAYINAFNAAQEGVTAVVNLTGIIRQLWQVG